MARGTSTTGREREAHKGAAVADRAHFDVDAGEGKEQVHPRRVSHGGQRLGGIALALVVLVLVCSRQGLLAQQILGASEATVVRWSGARSPPWADLGEAAGQDVVEEAAG